MNLANTDVRGHRYEAGGRIEVVNHFATGSEVSNKNVSTHAARVKNQSPPAKTSTSVKY